MARSVITRLRGGDRRSLGGANAVAAEASADSRIFRELVEALWHTDPVIAMRAADAAEKASLKNPKMLKPFTKELLGLLEEAVQQELRWHLAAMITRLELTREQTQRAVTALRNYLEDRSSIVKTFAMQALADLAERDEALKEEALEIVRRCTKTGTPAMRARGRKLLARLEH